MIAIRLRRGGKRKYKVPRGTAAKLAKELGLSAVQCQECVRGNRKPGVALKEALEREEDSARKRDS